MTGYDVHTDKAIKELRARLDQAERERDEAEEKRDALAEHVVGRLPYEAETDGEALDAWECVDAASREIARLQRERDEARAALASEPARIAAAEMARDVAWVIAIDSQCGGADVDDGIACATAEALGVTERVALRLLDGSPTTDEHIAAAIRAARGQA